MPCPVVPDVIVFWLRLTCLGCAALPPATAVTHWRHFRLTEEEELDEAGYYLELQSALGRYLQLLPGWCYTGKAAPYQTRSRAGGASKPSPTPSTVHTHRNTNEICLNSEHVKDSLVLGVCMYELCLCFVSPALHFKFNSCSNSFSTFCKVFQNSALMDNSSSTVILTSFVYQKYQ